jgi:hypothetical protein
MSVRPDDRINMRKNPYEEANTNKFGNKHDYYNMSIATFTFGGRQPNNLQMQMQMDEIDRNEMGEQNFHKEESAPSDKNFSEFNSSTIINKIGSHNSFLAVVIHSFWNLKILRNYFLNELSINEKDTKYKLLSEMQNLLLKYSKNKRIDLTKLRNSLADLFQNRRKFLIDQPDDPVDCYFTFLNAIHSNSMVYIFINR